MLPARVSMQKPACPILVTCTNSLSLCDVAALQLNGRRYRRPATACTLPTGALHTSTSLAQVEPVYGTVIQMARLIWKAQGLASPASGMMRMPTPGEAVTAITLSSNFDFTFAGLPAYKQ